MNKNTILFLGLVVLCVGVVIVINIAINSPEKETVAQRAVNYPKSVITHQHAVQAQAPVTEEKHEPMPEYEATVSNGTILF
jgi:hypothetical protein